jgi:hypothetical protein
MCEQCIEIDKKIDHYRWLATYVNDERTAKGINESSVNKALSD